jgi:hypothetical protein
VRGQQNFYVFLYFPSENLVKNEIWMKSWILVFCLGSVLNFNYYLFKFFLIIIYLFIYLFIYYVYIVHWF